MKFSSFSANAGSSLALSASSREPGDLAGLAGGVGGRQVVVGLE